MVAPRDAERTRDLLLDAGLACFAERGFDGTSIRAIAARAGLSLGLLYHYFPSKEALLHELMQRSGGLIQAVFVEVAAEPDAQRRLESLVRVSIRSMRDHLPFYQLSAKMRAQPEVMGALAEHIPAFEAALVAQFTALLDEVGMDAPEAHARLLIATLDGVCFQFATAPKTYPLDDVGERVLSLHTQPPPPPGKP